MDLFMYPVIKGVKDRVSKALEENASLVGKYIMDAAPASVRTGASASLANLPPNGYLIHVYLLGEQYGIKAVGDDAERREFHGTEIVSVQCYFDGTFVLFEGDNRIEFRADQFEDCVSKAVGIISSASPQKIEVGVALSDYRFALRELNSEGLRCTEETWHRIVSDRARQVADLAGRCGTLEEFVPDPEERARLEGFLSTDPPPHRGKPVVLRTVQS